MSKVASTVALYVDSSTNSTPDYLRVSKSTIYTEAYNPETEDFDYIVDLQKTTEVKSYAPTLDQEVAILPDEEDYEYFNTLRKALPTGAAAHKKFLRIYINDGDNTAGYAGILQDAVLTFNEYNAVDGKITFSIAFCGTPVSALYTITAGVPAVKV